MQRLHQTCVVCNKSICDGDVTNEHHPTYRSNGGNGTPTETLHRDCHLAIHAEDFKAWGRIGGQITATTTKVWLVNLLNVRTSKAYHLEREYYAIHGRRS
jgi:hypothetical protein